jgi:hypothetical protein
MIQLSNLLRKNTKKAESKAMRNTGFNSNGSQPMAKEMLRFQEIDSLYRPTTQSTNPTSNMVVTHPSSFLPSKPAKDQFMKETTH